MALVPDNGKAVRRHLFVKNVVASKGNIICASYKPLVVTLGCESACIAYSLPLSVVLYVSFHSL